MSQYRETEDCRETEVQELKHKLKEQTETLLRNQKEKREAEAELAKTKA